MSFTTSKYLVKYAVIPVYDYFYHIQLDLKAYVVGKCYLCSENKRYTEQDKSEIDYNVVFTWDPNMGKEDIKPQMEIGTNVVKNSTIVSKIFDTASECQAYADMLNNELIEEARKIAPFKAEQKKQIIKQETDIAKQHYLEENVMSR